MSVDEGESHNPKSRESYDEQVKTAMKPGPVIKVEPGIEIPSSRDPWIHRSDIMLCRTCMFFVSKELSDPRLTSPVGRCRRHAPTRSGYPVVFLNDWCGDHKLDENKA